MKIEVNIQKKHFFVLLGVILILGLVVYVRAAAVDTKVFHGVDQIDWAQPIQSSIYVNGIISVSGQPVLGAGATTITIGDLVSGDGEQKVILKADGKDAIVFNESNINITRDVRAPSLRIGNSGRITFISGSNPSCPGTSNIALLIRWDARTCGATGSGDTQCTTTRGWGGALNSPLTCNYLNNGIPEICSPDRWSRVLCMD